MTAYNSEVVINQDDSDVTIINHSFLYDQNDDQINSCIPIVRRLQQANQSTKNIPPTASKPVYNQTNVDSRQDYVFVDRDRQETAKQLEQILNYYRQDLKQESNTQLDCDRQLVTRLIDFIRPVYSSNKRKINDLDVLFEEISALHHARFVEQKEKTEQLYSEISHLKKLIITSANEDDSTMARIYRINSMNNYEQWMEMEEETRKLHNLVDAQRDRINELIKLISDEEIINNEKHHPTDNLSRLPIQELPYNATKKSNYEFPKAFSNDQMGKCSSALSVDNRNVSLESKQWECPLCNLTLLGDDDTAYLQHLALCYDGTTNNV